MFIKLFTDGSSLNNQNSKKGKSAGGIGIYIIYPNNEEKSITEILEGSKITNQVAELTALKRSLEILENNTIMVYLYTDSMYMINIFTNWIKKWEKNNWKKANNKEIENIELIKEIFYKINSLTYKIIFKHVKSHQEEPEKDSDKYIIWYGNNQADKLATYSASIAKEKLKDTK